MRRIDPQTAYRLYKGGMTLDQVAAQLGCSKTTIYGAVLYVDPQATQKYGHRRGIKRDPALDDRDGQMAALYNKGVSFSEIGAIYGLSRQRVHQIISLLKPVDSQEADAP